MYDGSWREGSMPPKIQNLVIGHISADFRLKGYN